ncbi:MAG: hypothetical protein AAFY71_07385 [Bacteroidota bacterium]
MKLHTKNYFPLLLAVGFLLVFTACENLNMGEFNQSSAEDITQDQVADAVEDIAARGSRDTTNNGRRGKRRDIGCFELVYPVTVAFPDGTTATADSAEALHALIKDWRLTADSTTTGRPTLVFPVSVITEDGDTVSIADETAFKELLADCGYGKRGKGKWGKRGNRCYELQFPITVSFPDSTTASADSASELHQIVRDWKVNNPNATERPEFVYPFSITLLSDGSTVTITSSADLAAVREDCYQGGRGTRCNNDSTGVDP